MMTKKFAIKNALISVSDKEGIEIFSKKLKKNGINIFSTGGTFKYLKKHKIDVIEISSITNFPEILDGRVKTLHPKVHGGILADKSNTKHLNTLKEHKIPTFDLVVVNLYPFEETVSKSFSSKKIIENIDIGGPTLIRASAKNYKNIIIITEKKDYELVLDYIKENKNIPLNLRQKLAAKAFSLTSIYDLNINNWFNQKEQFPNNLQLIYQKTSNLLYGENPHQMAAHYNDKKHINKILNSFQIQGKNLSYNNIHDADAAIKLINEFEDPAVAIIKHTNPCSVVTCKSIEKAYELAMKSDKLSAFGGILICNRKLTSKIAYQISKFFFEVVIIPSMEEKAKLILSSKPNIRVLILDKTENSNQNYIQIKSVINGLLIQENNNKIIKRKNLKVVSKIKPTPRQMHDMIFGLKIVKHVKSNAIVICKNGITLGIGSGQTSRVDACNIAIKKSTRVEQRDSANIIKNSIAASDAFFPFSDGVENLIKSGVKAIIQPGGSVNDQKIIDVADKFNICMVFSNFRNFNH